ncbi:unnamed protein product [Rhodiola kirilowii]
MANQIESSPDFDVDKLTSKIFSILENNFLFGANPKQLIGKVRILSIDAAGLTDGILAAKSLSLLESSIQSKSANPHSSIADYFDVASGSGTGGILAALLFTRGPDGRPLNTADEALHFLVNNNRRLRRKRNKSALGRLLCNSSSSSSSSSKALTMAFGQLTLKDTLKALLIPCYDLSTRVPLVFSRADAVEADAFDFKLSHVCSATTADPEHAVQMRSADKKTKIVAAGGGGLAVNNPTAVAITHVLNNKHEFPLCRGVEDLLVLSLGNGENAGGRHMTSSPSQLATIASETTSHLVDEAVSMAFGECRSTNYVRIQANCTMFPSKSNHAEIINSVEDMLRQKNVESVLFKGKQLVDKTNAEKLDLFAGGLIKEQQRRKTDTLPTVLLKHAEFVPSPRTSSATTLSTVSSS